MWFGLDADCDTNTLLKISSVDHEELKKKLNKVPIQNLAEERSVGFINYELDIGEENISKLSML